RHQSQLAALDEEDRDTPPCKASRLPRGGAVAVPKYQELMLPILRLLEDGRDWRTSELRAALSEEFGLSQDDLRERIPSGTSTRFAKNVDWSRHYLKRAGVLEAPGRAIARITARGRELLSEEHEKVDVPLLQRYSEFTDFRSRERSAEATQTSEEESADEPPALDDLNPEDAVREHYRRHRDRVTDELLERVLEESSDFFEVLVVRLMEKLGYAGEDGQVIHLGRVGDGGVDGLISPDRLGLESVYLQAKRWDSTPVGRPAVQAFSGSLDMYRATKGVFITTSSFTKGAREYAETIQKTIILIDGGRLVDLMYEVDLGVTTQDTIELKQLDSDFFNED
ncbi:MAG: restriction endonuclease, partial [Chloroflexi bacterium]|nr:restriction endonuclease [Chloroflexota bacterium]